MSSSDQEARERTLGRYWAIVFEWATGRLPGWAREGADTNDLVQVVLVRAWHQMERFEDQPEAFKAFLRRILQNEVIDRIRSAKRHPGRVELSEDLRDQAPSALEVVIEKEFAETYRAMLVGLRPRRREALVLRLEGRHTYVEIAKMTGCSANAARMRVARALEDLTAMTMRQHGPIAAPNRKTRPAPD